MSRFLAVLFVVTLVTSASVTLRPASLLMGRPFTEDGFYVLTIARHAARGHGFTIDGSTPTNGFHPLYTIAVTGLAALTGDDRAALVRAVYVLEWTVYLMAAVVLGRIAADLVETDRRRAAFLATAAIYLGLRFVLLQHFNGLETGLLLLVVAVLWRTFIRWDTSEPAGSVRFGILLGLAALTRLDAVFLIAAAVALVGLTSRPRMRTRATAITAILPVLFLAPWLVFSYGVSGTLIPTSGLAQQAWGFVPVRWLSAALAVVQAGVPVYLGAFEGWPVSLGRAIVLAAAVAIGYGPVRRIRESGAPGRRAVEFGLALWCAYLLLSAWYASSSWATHFYVRYSSPLLLVPCLVGGMTVSWLAVRHRAIAVLVMCLIGLQAVAYAAALGTGVYAGTCLPRVAPWAKPLFLDQVRLVQAYVPAEVTVAAGQSGTLGYYRERVLNVDGKVNGEALDYQDRMPEYLDARGVRWFCDMPDYAERYLGPRPEMIGWHQVAEAGLFRLYHRVGP